jgi:hypothetical protein
VEDRRVAIYSAIERLVPFNLLLVTSWPWITTVGLETSQLGRIGTTFKSKVHDRVGRISASWHTRQVNRVCPLVAGSCRPQRSCVRPLPNALQAFNTQWPWAPCGSGMKVANPGHLRRSSRPDRRSESVPVDDAVPKINGRQVISSPAVPFPCSARSHETRCTGAPDRPGARKFAVSAPNPSSARKPAWMLDFALEIRRQLENRPDGKLPPGTQRDILTVRFTV